jgi:hypothetical protein
MSADGGIHAKRTTNKTEVYLETLKNCVELAIQNKWRGMLTSHAGLLHGNERQNTSTAVRTQTLLEHFN